MQANEVRRGNLVEYDNRVFEIDVIAEEFPTLNTIEFGIGVVDWDNIKGIPLTEEWLAKSELKLKVYNGVIKSYYAECTPDNYKSEMQLHVRFGERRDVDFMVYWYHALKSGDMHTFTHIRYIHQLQNLYFALTNEELKL